MLVHSRNTRLSIPIPSLVLAIFLALLVLPSLPSAYAKGGGGSSGGGGGSSGGGRSGGSSGSSGSSSGSSGSSGTRSTRGVTSSSGVYYPYYPIGVGNGWYYTGGYYRTNACQSDSSVVIVNNEAYVCSEFLKCTNDNDTIVTTANVSRTCGDVARYDVYQAQMVDEPLSTGTIVGIVVGVLAVFIGVIVCCWYLRRRMAGSHKVSGAALSVTPFAKDPEWNEPRPAYSAESSWNNASNTDYQNAKAFEATNPPPRSSAPTAEEQWAIRDRGIGAWAFVTTDPASVTTTFKGDPANHGKYDGTSDVQVLVHFHPTRPGRDVSVLSELPLGLDPVGFASNRDFYYFEVTVEETSFHPHTTVISVGLATRPYAPFRMIGHQKYSVGYHSDDGHCFVNDSFGGRLFGSPYTQDSVVGVGYVYGTGSVFFTLNGVLVGEATTLDERVLHPYHAAVAADGPAKLSVNFGQRPFLYPNANPDAVDPTPSYYRPPGPDHPYPAQPSSSVVAFPSSSFQ